VRHGGVGLWLFVCLAAATAVGVWLTGRAVPTGTAATGISRALASNRAARVTGLTYDVHLRVPTPKTDPVTGTLTATFTLTRPADGLAFDFGPAETALHSTTVNGQVVEPHVDSGHILLSARSLVAGKNEVTFEFTAGDAALNRQDELLYTLFVPARASLTLPCLDQPNLKARWRLRLDIPIGWTAVSNGRESGRVATSTHVGYLFEETAPLPTYLFAFAAGRFQVEYARRNDQLVRMYHRETDVERVSKNRQAVFDLHDRAITWLEDYTAIAYPFGKLDFVLIPSFQFSGMEHPGAIFYNANTLLLDATATENQFLSRASVIAHETAHMWFGNFVTMQWFDDVWMKEVFANFMAAKIVNPSFPGVNHDLRFLLQHYPAAYDVDRTAGTNPIRQTLPNLDEAGSLYGAIIYQKAPIVMRQLERLVGETTLRDGLREYLTLHGFSNAAWPDLVGILDDRSPHDLQAWSHAWVSERGRPTIATELAVEGGRITALRLRQSDPAGRSLLWTEQLDVIIGRSGQVERHPLTINAAVTDVPGVVGTPTPDWILPTGQGLGYGDFDLDRTSLDWLVANAATIGNPVDRGAAYVALWESMLDGDVRVDQERALVFGALARETDSLNVQLLLDQARGLFWRFTRDADRTVVAAELEPILRAGLDRANSSQAKGAWFATLRSVAVTPRTVAWLADVWARKYLIVGLTLSEVDDIDLALDLAVRSAEPDVVAAQLARTTNADRKARLTFIAPAVSPDPSVREAFFRGLADVKNRAREAWVLDAARYLHHPLRAADSARLVVPALELVREIQRTGDIFFPKRWADATLSGYQSEEMSTRVSALIAALPADYPARLRWVLLSSADPLFRAARLVGQRR
jgi:aminopeptidase N